MLDDILISYPELSGSDRSDTVTDKLCELADEHGTGIFSDSSALQCALNEKLPGAGYRKERNRIRDACECGAIGTLLENKDCEGSFKPFFDRAVAALTDDAEILQSRAAQVLYRFAFAIDYEKKASQEKELERKKAQELPDNLTYGKKQYRIGTYEGELSDGVPWGNGTLTLNSGDRYVGSFRQGKFNGTGTLFYKNGNVYEGGFRDNERHGTGTMIFASGRKYTGGYVNGKRSGHGVYTYENGNVYEGDFLNGKPNGQGETVCTDGTRHKGGYKDGMPSGEGSFCDADGIIYEGVFSGKRIEGEAVVRFEDGGRMTGTFDGSVFTAQKCEYANGDVYTGEFENNVPHGNGTVIYKDGATYTGFFSGDMRNGFGTLNYQNGNVYEGEFRDDIREGRGTFIFTDGKKYIGEFKNGNYNGKGTFYYKSGNVYEGDFVSGLREGEGIMTYATGDRFVGEYKKDKMCGFGTYYYSNGDIYEGEWDNNQMHGTGTLTLGKTTEVKWENGDYDTRDRYEGTWKNGLKDGSFVHISLGMLYNEEYSAGKRVPGKVITNISSDHSFMGRRCIKARYGGQNAFMIETATSTLLFNWYKKLMPEIRYDKPLHVFMTSTDPYNFNPDIFSLAETFQDIHFYMGYDRSDPKINKILKELPPRTEDRLSCFSGEQNLSVDFGSIRSLQSTGSGSAFIIEIDGMTLLNAGDLLWQDSSGKTILMENNSTISVTDFVREKSIREDKFKAYTKPLKGMSIDYAMLPLDPRFGDFGDRTVKHYLDTAKIMIFTPMFVWDNYDYISSFASKNPNLAKKMIAVNPGKQKILFDIDVNKTYSINFEKKIIK